MIIVINFGQIHVDFRLFPGSYPHGTGTALVQRDRHLKIGQKTDYEKLGFEELQWSFTFDF